MKKNFLAVFAIVLAIGFSAFTMKPTTSSTESTFTAAPVYFVYDGGTERDISSYPVALRETELPDPCGSTGIVCWFKVEDKDSDNDIDNGDFLASFDAIDVGGNQLISDQTEDHVKLELKN